MKGCKFIDTNVLIRIWEAKKEYVDWLQKANLKGDEVIIPSLVIAEVIWVLTSFYKKSRAEIKEFVDSILGTSLFKVETRHDFGKALNLYSTTNVKFTDCLIAAYMGKNDTIVSEDRDFDKFDGIKRVEPKALAG